MASFNLAPGIFGAGAQFFGAVGANYPPNLPLNAGLLKTFAAGTSSPLATYSNSIGTIPNATSIVLGADGRIPNEIWFPSGVAYKFTLTDSLGYVIQTWDNLVGVNDIGGGITSEWIASGFAPTYNGGGNSFTTSTNSTATFQIGRRVQVFGNNFNYLYGSVVTATGTGPTTVTLSLDSGVMDGSLSVANVALLGAVNPSVPVAIPYETAAFHAHKNAVQSTGTTVIYDVVDNVSPSGSTAYNNSTGIFTAPFTGWYVFNATIYQTNNSGGALAGGLQITVNSVAVAISSVISIANGASTFSSTGTTVFVTAGQQVLVASNQGFTGTFTATASTGSAFNGALIERTA
jgi:hypothetical protein